MKRIYVMTAVFLFCLLGPNLLFPLFRNESDTENGENRILAQFPEFSPETIDRFPVSVENYINDHAAFRSRFLSLNSVLNLKLFDYADSQDVITGKDGWYFYSAGSSVEDFLGVNRFSAGRLKEIAGQVQAVHDVLAEKGVLFLVLIAPNKEGIYREYLPDGFRQTQDVTRREELIAYLKQHTDVSIIDPAPFLTENRDFLWYYKTDTHWNDAAGFVVSQMIIEAAGGTPLPLDRVRISYSPCENGDLANLFHLPEGQGNDMQASVAGSFSDLPLTSEDENGDGNIVHVTSADAPDTRRAAVYRDSFGAALFSGLSPYFLHTDYYHWQFFNHSLLEQNPPDILIYEVVERDLDRISEDLQAIAPEAF